MAALLTVFLNLARLLNPRIINLLTLIYKEGTALCVYECFGTHKEINSNLISQMIKGNPIHFHEIESFGRGALDE